MIQFTPIRGFINTPVSKSICIITTLVAVLASIAQTKYAFNLQIDPFILEYSQYWRIMTYQLSVVNESDFLLVFLLWFMYKNLERFYGSRKYLSLVTVFGLYNSLVCFIVMCVGQIIAQIVQYLLFYYLRLGNLDSTSEVELIFNKVTPGPLGIISSLYVCYGKVIPVSYRFKIVLTPPTINPPMLNPDNNEEESETSTASSHIPTETTTSRELTLTNHLQIHILFALLLLNNGFQSIIPCLVGIFLGSLHINDLLPGAKWILPNTVFKFFISPINSVNNFNNSVSRNITGGYDRISGSHSETVQTVDYDGEDDDQQDEIRSNDGRIIRAETPVRPLGRQFLDTFRSHPN